MNEQNVELNPAIVALTRSVEAMEKRVSALDDRIVETTTYRKSILTDLVAKMLPDTSSQTLSGLQTLVPAFITVPVSEAFKANKKFLGLFAGAKYHQTVTLLQTRLSSHLDQQKYGELKAIDANIMELSKEKAEISARSKDALAILTALQEAAAKKIPLSPPLVSLVQQIAVNSNRRARELRDRRSSDSNRASFGRYEETTVDDNFDIWYYLITDIPLSARTFLIDSITSYDDELRRRQTECRQEESRQDERIESNSDASRSDDGAPSTPEMGVAAGAVTAGVAAGVAVGVGVLASELTENALGADGSPIATDDSLGYFS